MPITKSAKKSLRVSKAKKAQNDSQKMKLEKALKKVDAKTVNEVVSLIDKAAKTNIIAKNKAARMKSQLAKKFGTPKTEKKVAAPAKKTVAKKSTTNKTETKSAVKKPTTKAKKSTK